MAQTYTLDTLTQALPEFALRVWNDDISTPEALQAAINSVGVADIIEFHRGGPRAFHRLEVEQVENEKAAETKLRSAIARKVGKAVGSKKEWYLGGYTMSIRWSGQRLNIDFARELSLTEMRAAAKDWLDGVDARTCFSKHGFIEAADAEPNERGYLPANKKIASTPQVNIGEDRARASAFHAPGLRPPGTKYSSDEEAFANAVAFFKEMLGEEDPKELGQAAPRWSRGNREFRYRTMSSRSRSLEYSEKYQGD